MPKYTLVVPPPTMNVTLAWDPSASTNIITNYTLWWGRMTSNYNTFTNAQTNLTKTIVLNRALPWYFSATATDKGGLMSDFSDEISMLPPKTNVVVTVSTTVTNWLPYVVTNPPIRYFYRSTATKIGGNKWRMVMQRTGGLNIIWQEWTNWWAPFTNSQAPQDIRLDVYTRHQ